jgi:hypothetical protein
MGTEPWKGYYQMFSWHESVCFFYFDKGWLVGLKGKGNEKDVLEKFRLRILIIIDLCAQRD